LVSFPKLELAIPDFGATAACLFLLWYCLDNDTGDAEWLRYCRSNLDWLLGFCLGAYDQHCFYVLPHSENNTKVLLLPRFNYDGTRAASVDQYTYHLKVAINEEMEQKGNLNRLFRKISIPRYDHVKEIIEGWQIPRYWKNQRSWEFTGWSEAGEFIGGLGVGTLKALTS